MFMRRARAYSSSCLQVIFNLSPFILLQFTLLQPKIAKKSLKLLFLVFKDIQGHRFDICRQCLL